MPICLIVQQSMFVYKRHKRPYIIYDFDETAIFLKKTIAISEKYRTLKNKSRLKNVQHKRLNLYNLLTARYLKESQRARYKGECTLIEVKASNGMAFLLDKT